MADASHKRTLYLIIIIVILYSFGLTIVLPLFPFLLEQYVPSANIAIVLGILFGVFALAQFLAAPIFGALSDRFGRKPILIISLLGSTVGFILMGIGGALWVLFLGRIIDGLTAGDQGSLFASVTDNTKPKERAKWFGYLGGAIGVGFMIGPAIGGVLGAISITLPFYVTAGITLLMTLIIAIFLKESLPPEKRTKKLTLQHFNTAAQFKQVFSMRDARNLLVMGAFFYVGLNIWQFNASVFLKDVFMWGPSFIGGVFILVGICDILSRVVVLPQLLKIWNERKVGITGLIGMSVGLGLIFLSAFVPNIAILVAAIVCIVLGEGLFDPSYNAQLANSVEQSKQGLLQGTNQSIQALYHVLVPLGAGVVYTYSQGGVFGIAAVLMVVGLFIFSRLKLKPVPDEAVAPVS